MYRNSTLSLLSVLLFSFVINAVNAQTPRVYVNNGTATSYSLNNGDSLYIASGTYTGSITAFNNGARITVAAGATFQPQTISNPRGIILIYGTGKFAELKPNDGFILTNYGTLWVTGTVEFNGSGENWINQYGGNMKFDRGFTINNANTLTNRGSITTSGDVTLNNGAALINKYTINITGSFTANGSAFTNEAFFLTSNTITFNWGAVVNNSCRLISNTGFTVNSTSINNNGLLWAKAGNNAGNIVNNGTITNGATAKIKSVNFLNNGTIKGAGYLYFTGATTNYGITGVTGTTSDTLKVYDASRLNPLTIFDIQYGSVRPNTVYRAFTAPDTVNNLSSCSVELLSNIPLPVKWNYFYAGLTGGIPSLNWSSDQDAGTVFEIQRSYNGTQFETIHTITSSDKNTYRYDDQQVNAQVSVVYYRIKAIEANGAYVFSEMRAVKTTTKTGAVTIQAAPNPFTSQFIIYVPATERKMVTIRVFSLNGQLQFSKTAHVSNGLNNIVVTEAASLTKGMYMVQLNDANGIIATEKLIKQ